MNADEPSKARVFNIDRGTGGQPQMRSNLVLDRATGDVVRWETFSTYTRGRQLRSILRLGIPGQLIAGLVSTGGAFLAVTGLALAIRRLLGWRARRHAISAPSDGILAPTITGES